MNIDLGPWTTAFSNGSCLELSGSWRRRMASLPLLAGGARSARDNAVALVIALCLAGLPLVQGKSPAADRSNSGREELTPLSGDAIAQAAPADAIAAEAAPAAAPRQRDAAAAAVDGPPAEHDDRLSAALRRGVAGLSGLQQNDGSWNSDTGSWRVGVTSLASLALTRAGVRPDDLRLRRALGFLRRQSGEANMTYELSLLTLVLCAVEPEKHPRLIRDCVARLERTQLAHGPNRGGWSYGFAGPNGGGDRSNSEFAIWALDAAARRGAKVQDSTWQAALTYWLDGQTPGGGWSYNGPGPPTGSMTAAGVASVALCRAQRESAGQAPADAEAGAIARGEAWLAANYSVERNPGASMWVLYYLVMLRRAGDAARTERLGDHHWRRDLEDGLIRMQGQDGCWRGHGHAEDDPVTGTSFALLALAGVDESPESK